MLIEGNESLLSSADSTNEGSVSESTNGSLLSEGNSTSVASNSAQGATDGVSQTQENKSDANQANQQNDSQKTAEVKQGAPEKYEAFKLPEGMNLDSEANEKFVSLAKSLNLSQEQAQGLVSLQAEISAKQQQDVLSNYQNTVRAWKDETVKALGPDYKKEIGVAVKAIDRFGSPELKQLLEDTGLGNNKEFVQFAVKVGKAISEGSFVDGKSGASKTDAEIFYPEMVKSFK